MIALAPEPVAVTRNMTRMSAHVRPCSEPDPAQSAFVRVRDGDQRAFAEFYDEVSPVVYGTILRVLRAPSLAEEVTQEVFVELWRTAARFDPERGSVRSWAATIAHRRAVDRVRSEQSARHRDETEGRQRVAEHDEVVEEVAARLDRERVAAAMLQLSDSQREAVTLAYYDGLTYREVALRLGVPEGTIKTRIRDGLIKLRHVMGAPT